MLSSPKISILIPTFNAEKNIAKALDSILQQTLQAYEVLVVDGGSSDATLSIIKKYAQIDGRIQWMSEEDEGIYDAMNKGIKKSEGKWIFFLGCDDTFYTNDVLHEVNKVIETEKDVQLIYGDVKLNKPMGYHSKDLIYAGAFDENKLLQKNICHQSIFYKKSLFQKFGTFRTKYRIFADYDFNLRCFSAIKSHYINKIIANFNVGGHSNTQQSQDTLFNKELLQNMAVYYSYNYRHSFFEGKKRELLSIMIRNVGSFKLISALKIIKIIIYQTLKNNHKNNSLI